MRLVFFDLHEPFQETWILRRNNTFFSWRHHLERPKASETRIATLFRQFQSWSELGIDFQILIKLGSFWIFCAEGYQGSCMDCSCSFLSGTMLHRSSFECRI